jgi:hypothetical protein
MPASSGMRMAATAALLAAFSSVVAPAPAGTTYETTLYLNPRAPAFHGRIHSPIRFCKADRVVKLLKRRPGRDRVLGKDQSGTRGYWRVRVRDPASGAYYARTRRYGSASLGINCERDRSRVRRVD